jgi:uncharacterized OB-fold protein
MDVTHLFTVGGDGSVRLVGARCTNCGTFAFPARPVCAVCRSRSLEVAELPARGRVDCWSRVELPPAGFDEAIVVANVELDGGPTIFTLLDGEPASDRVEAVAHPIRHGAPGYAFRSVS